MTNPPRRETAKVYRFPTRMRVAPPETTPVERANAARLFSICDYGSGWYHEAAIQDDHRGRRN